MATSGVGTVLFKRGQNGSGSENELWDDTALIKAYDNAVKLMKNKIKEENGEETPETVPATSHRKKKKSSKRKRKNKQKQWNPGDQCRAVFTEDNLIYDAEIMSLDEDKNTCVVRYRGYGNEEEQNVSKLLQPTGRKQKQRTISDVETDSMDWSGQSPLPKSKAKQERSHHTQSSQGFPWQGAHTFPPFAGMPPPQFPFTFPSFQGYPSTGFPTGLPTVPPPPPPINNDAVSGDNEALCSMLMSWYMSGYHTGYYQGLKQAQKSGNSVLSESSR